MRSGHHSCDNRSDHRQLEVHPAGRKEFVEHVRLGRPLSRTFEPSTGSGSACELKFDALPRRPLSSGTRHPFVSDTVVLLRGEFTGGTERNRKTVVLWHKARKRCFDANIRVMRYCRRIWWMMWSATPPFVVCFLWGFISVSLKMVSGENVHKVLQ